MASGTQAPMPQTWDQKLSDLGLGVPSNNTVNFSAGHMRESVLTARRVFQADGRLKPESSAADEVRENAAWMPATFERQEPTAAHDMSGLWRGYFWQPHGRLTCTDKHLTPDGEVIQLSEMELVFSDGAEQPFPHQRVSGTGTDALGTWELRAGRRFASAGNIEWVKTYTALSDPTAVQNEALECVPEVFCEGQLDPTTSVISGRWHMCWRMSARCYKAPRFDGDDDPPNVWCAQHAHPMSVTGLVLQVRKPELWDQRFELARLVEDQRMKRPEERYNQPLTEAEWKTVVKSPTLDGFFEARQEGDTNEALMKAVRRAKLLVEESRNTEPRVNFEPEGWSPNDPTDWQMVELHLPSVHVSGQFVLWPKGLPQHLVYPALASAMPHVHISSLLSRTVSAESAFNRVRRNEASMSDGVAQRCLILELGKIDRLSNFATPPGMPPNLYLEAKVGGQKLLCQPLIAKRANDIASEVAFNERFLIFLDGDAELEVLNGSFLIEIKLMHKQIEGTNYDQDGGRRDSVRQSVGGPPYLCASLGEQLDDLMIDTLYKQVEKMINAAYREPPKGLEAAGGFFRHMVHVLDKAANTYTTSDSPVHTLRPSKAPKDVCLATGTLDVTKDVLLQEGLRLAEIQLTCPMDQLLLNRKMDSELTREVRHRLEMALEAQKVGAISSAFKAFGFADMEALFNALVIGKEDIGMLLASSELQDSELFVGRLHAHLACVEWGGGDPSPATIVRAPEGSSARNVFQGFDDIGTNPYDMNTRGTFVQYGWETQEHRDMKKMVDQLEAKYAIEDEQRRSLKVLKRRVEGRHAELVCARKRQHELQVLEGLANFVQEHYNDSTVLFDAVNHQYVSAGQTSLIWAAKPAELTQILFEAQRTAMIPEEDGEMVKFIQTLLDKQSELLELWQGGFDRASLAGKPTKEETNLRETMLFTSSSIQGHDEREMHQSIKMLGQSGRAQWDDFRSKKRELVNLMAEGFARMDAQHNGMLRRHNEVLSLLCTLEYALKSVLPNEYRSTRMILMLTIGHYFRQWRWTPRDWASRERGTAKGIGESLFKSIASIGSRPRPPDHGEVNRYHGTVVRLDEFHREQQQAIVQEAKSRSWAPLATIGLRGQKVQPATLNSSSGAPPLGKDCEQDLNLPETDYRLCKKVDRLIDSVSERRRYIERVLEMDGAMAPRPEPAPLHAYHIHVSTFLRPSRGVGSAGAILKLSHLAHQFAMEKTIDIEIGSHNKVYGAGRRVKDTRLFESQTTDIFRVLFREDLGEVTAVGLTAKDVPVSLPEGKDESEGAASDANHWLVDRVTVYKAPNTVFKAMDDVAVHQAINDATGRSWLFQSPTTIPRGAVQSPVWSRHSVITWGPVAVGTKGSVTRFMPQATLHIVVQAGVVQELEEDDLLVTLYNTSANPPLKSGPCSLVRALPLEEGKTARHFVLHYDDHGEPLLRLGAIDEIEIKRPKRSGSAPGTSAPYYLESISIWWRNTDMVRHFPCAEWLDQYEGAFTTKASKIRKKLRCTSNPKGDGCFHLSAPPPPPTAPVLEMRDVAGLSWHQTEQMLVITVALGPQWAKSLERGVSWRLQCVPEEHDLLEEHHLTDARQGVSAGDAGVDGDRAKVHGFEMTLQISQLRVELPLTAIKIGGLPLVPGRVYLWRVAAKHGDFGEGAFSPCARVTLYQDVCSLPAMGQPPGWRIHDQTDHDQTDRRLEQLPEMKVVNALNLGGEGTPPALLEQGAAAIGTIKAFANSLAALPPLAFEDAESPPGNERPLLSLVGDAEVIDGAIDLTPLHKGCGLSGAVWFHRPLKIVDGFETTFTFVIRPPQTDEGEWGKPRSRGSDGFAFVLQLDRDGIIEKGPKAGLSGALGASGIQLGYGGLSSCVAVQFATQPSCQREVMVKDTKGGDEGDGTYFLCSLLYEPHVLLNGELDPIRSKRSHFYVDSRHAGKECIDPLSHKVFVAPSVPTNWQEIELPHHSDSVSVQCPGVHPNARNSSGPEACMAKASKLDLDDSMQHTARILLERNRFRASSVSKKHVERETLEQSADGSPSHRLLVYVDDMQTALINLELDLPETFGDTLSEFDGCMFAGFTAGTGLNNASHVITSWRFYEAISPAETSARMPSMDPPLPKAFDSAHNNAASAASSSTSAEVLRPKVAQGLAAPPNDDGVPAASRSDSSDSKLAPKPPLAAPLPSQRYILKQRQAASFERQKARELSDAIEKPTESPPPSPPSSSKAAGSIDSAVSTRSSSTRGRYFSCDDLGASLTSLPTLQPIESSKGRKKASRHANEERAKSKVLAKARQEQTSSDQKRRGMPALTSRMTLRMRPRKSSSMDATLASNAVFEPSEGNEIDESNEELAPVGRRRPITMAFNLVDPELFGDGPELHEAATFAAEPNDPDTSRMRSRTMARLQRRDTPVEAKLDQREGALSCSFLMDSERPGWHRFVMEALMPGVKTHFPIDQLAMFGAQHRSTADFARGSGTIEVSKLRILLENLKERAIASSHGLLSWRNNLTKVRGYVSAIWKDTNRLSVHDCQKLLSEMFYQVAQQPNEVRRLAEFWYELLKVSMREPTHVFLEPSRLTLLCFYEVFVGSDALTLLICHYIRSAPEERLTDHSKWERTDRGTERCGGLTIAVLNRLLRVCLECDDQMVLHISNQIETMAALSLSMEMPSLMVSAAQLDVRTLAAILGNFVSSFKPGAAIPRSVEETTQQVERFEKMSLVKQQLRRQVTIMRSHQLAGSHQELTPSGRLSLESPEGSCMHDLLNMLVMKDLMPIKHKLSSQRLWSCMPMPELFQQMNTVKAQLLGSGAEVIRSSLDLSLPELNAKLCDASSDGNTELLQSLIRRRANVLQARTKERGYTPVMMASESGRTRALQLLLQHNGEVNVKAKDGQTAVMRASARGHSGVLRLLLQHKADVNAKAKDGQTAVMMASAADAAAAPAGEHFGGLQLLLDRHANANAVAKNGSTALMVASQHEHVQAIKLLLNSDAKRTVNAAAKKDRHTALMIACGAHGRVDAIQILVDSKALLNATAKDGHTALMMASAHGHVAAVDLLLELRANVNAKTEDRQTAIMLAGENGHIEVINALLPSVLGSSEEAVLRDKLNILMKKASEDGATSQVVDCIQALEQHFSSTANMEWAKSWLLTTILTISSNAHCGKTVQAVLMCGCGRLDAVKVGQRSKILSAITDPPLDTAVLVSHMVNNFVARSTAGLQDALKLAAFAQREGHRQRTHDIASADAFTALGVRYQLAAGAVLSELRAHVVGEMLRAPAGRQLLCVAQLHDLKVFIAQPIIQTCLVAEWRGGALHFLLDNPHDRNLFDQTKLALLLATHLLLQLAFLPIVASHPYFAKRVYESLLCKRMSNALPEDISFYLLDAPLIKFTLNAAVDVYVSVLITQYAAVSSQSIPLILFAVASAWAEVREMLGDLSRDQSSHLSYVESFQIRLEEYLSDELNLVDVIGVSSTCVVLFSETGARSYLLCLAVLCHWLKLLRMLRLSSTIGPLVLMMIKMLFRDILRWLALLLALLVALSSALYALHTAASHDGLFGASDYILCVDPDAVYTLSGEGWRWWWYITVAWEGALSSNVEFTCARYGVTPWLSATLLYVQQTVIAILLINMLIAMMGKTFDGVYEAQAVNYMYLFSETVTRWRMPSMGAPPPFNLLSLPLNLYILLHRLICRRGMEEQDENDDVLRFQEKVQSEGWAENIARFIEHHQFDVEQQELWRTNLNKTIGRLESAVGTPNQPGGMNQRLSSLDEGMNKNITSLDHAINRGLTDINKNMVVMMKELHTQVGNLPQSQAADRRPQELADITPRPPQRASCTPIAMPSFLAPVVDAVQESNAAAMIERMKKSWIHNDRTKMRATSGQEWLQQWFQILWTVLLCNIHDPKALVSPGRFHVLPRWFDVLWKLMESSDHSSDTLEVAVLAIEDYLQRVLPLVEDVMLWAVGIAHVSLHQLFEGGISATYHIDLLRTLLSAAHAAIEKTVDWFTDVILPRVLRRVLPWLLTAVEPSFSGQLSFDQFYTHLSRLSQALSRFAGSMKPATVLLSEITIAFTDGCNQLLEAFDKAAHSGRLEKSSFVATLREPLQRVLSAIFGFMQRLTHGQNILVSAIETGKSVLEGNNRKHIDVLSSALFTIFDKANTGELDRESLDCLRLLCKRDCGTEELGRALFSLMDVNSSGKALLDNIVEFGRRMCASIGIVLLKVLECSLMVGIEIFANLTHSYVLHSTGVADGRMMQQEYAQLLTEGASIIQKLIRDFPNRTVSNIGSTAEFGYASKLAPQHKSGAEWLSEAMQLCADIFGKVLTLVSDGESSKVDATVLGGLTRFARRLTRAFRVDHMNFMYQLMSNGQLKAMLLPFNTVLIDLALWLPSACQCLAVVHFDTSNTFTISLADLTGMMQRGMDILSSMCRVPLEIVAQHLQPSRLFELDDFKEDLQKLEMAISTVAGSDEMGNQLLDFLEREHNAPHALADIGHTLGFFIDLFGRLRLIDEVEEQDPSLEAEKNSGWMELEGALAAVIGSRVGVSRQIFQGCMQKPIREAIAAAVTTCTSKMPEKLCHIFSGVLNEAALAIDFGDLLFDFMDKSGAGQIPIDKVQALKHVFAAPHKVTPKQRTQAFFHLFDLHTTEQATHSNAILASLDRSAKLLLSAAIAILNQMNATFIADLNTMVINDILGEAAKRDLTRDTLQSFVRHLSNYAHRVWSMCVTSPAGAVGAKVKGPPVQMSSPALRRVSDAASLVGGMMVSGMASFFASKRKAGPLHTLPPTAQALPHASAYSKTPDSSSVGYSGPGGGTSSAAGYFASKHKTQVPHAIGTDAEVDTSNANRIDPANTHWDMEATRLKAEVDRLEDKLMEARRNLATYMPYGYESEQIAE